MGGSTCGSTGCSLHGEGRKRHRAVLGDSRLRINSEGKAEELGAQVVGGGWCLSCKIHVVCGWGWGWGWDYCGGPHAPVTG